MTPLCLTEKWQFWVLFIISCLGFMSPIFFVMLWKTIGKGEELIKERNQEIKEAVEYQKTLIDQIALLGAWHIHYVRMHSAKGSDRTSLKLELQEMAGGLMSGIYKPLARIHKWLPKSPDSST